MNIHYRIVKVDPEAHGVVIRYFTDVVTEMDLANLFNEDGTVKLNADGYPLSTRTDVLMSIYDTPTPSTEELDRRIMANAPVDWLKLQEDIVNPDIDTKMRDIRNLVGDTKAFTTEDVHQIRADVLQTEAAAAAPRTPTEEDNVKMAYDTVLKMMDALKVLAKKDPAVVEEFINGINSLKPPQ